MACESDLVGGANNRKDIAMIEEELRRVESSQRQHHQELEHEARMIAACEVEEFNLFALLRPKLCVDGNMWCCLYGDDLQCGIAGFGDSPRAAILDWNSSWHRKLRAAPQNIKESQATDA